MNEKKWVGIGMKGKCRGKGENEAFYEENKRKMKTIEENKRKKKNKISNMFFVLFILFFFINSIK